MTTTTITKKDALTQGLKRYFTGVPCKRGHVSERMVSSAICLDCHREKMSARYHADPEAAREYNRDYERANRAAATARTARYRAKDPQRMTDYNRTYSAERRASDPAYALLVQLRNRVGSALRQLGGEKSAATMTLVGCTVPALMAHIEKQFLPGMTWENRSEWHIDHIRPCSSFDMLDPEQQRECFHWSNLQPLWSEDNLRKGAKH
jgi:hypothetical protein